MILWGIYVVKLTFEMSTALISDSQTDVLVNVSKFLETENVSTTGIIFAKFISTLSL